MREGNIQKQARNANEIKYINIKKLELFLEKRVLTAGTRLCQSSCLTPAADMLAVELAGEASDAWARAFWDGWPVEEVTWPRAEGGAPGQSTSIAC